MNWVRGFRCGVQFAQCNVFLGVSPGAVTSRDGSCAFKGHSTVFKGGQIETVSQV